MKYAIANGIPVPGYVNALSYFDAYQSEKLPANIYKHNETTLAHIPMNVLIRKVSFTRFGIKGQKLEDAI
ncbi:hypothetical protein GCM10022218_50780 [Sphingobacterium ginsenosidimutans]|uniref:Uncharacterized protein n=1 Tax=Sphingobacterium ginsenosidimutans TaxID=687845 RepID=A0ABP8ANC5_9SPHI